MMITALEDRFIPDLVRIGKEQLGHDYIEDSDFLEIRDTPGQFCLVAVEDDAPVGFVIGRMFPRSDEPKELNLPDCPERDDVTSHGMIGLLDSVAVDASCVGRGIGHTLCGKALDYCRDEGCGVAVSMAWVHPDGVEPISRSLTKSGFERTGLVIKGYWNQWVDPVKGHDCPICGAPCHCSAALWIRRLDRRVRSPSRRCPCRPLPCWSR